MRFVVDARTVLELGKELISSDEIAIYELIKNSMDAGSDKVNIFFRTRFLHSDFLETITILNRESIRDEIKIKRATNYVRKNLYDIEDERSTKFMDKLEKAGNKKCSIEFEQVLREEYKKLNYIIIKDTGHGMTEEELKNVFLRIGTMSRKNSRSKKSYLGNKGIGRLSAMRLGNILNVKTARETDGFWNQLTIDWNDFDCEYEKSIDEVNVKTFGGEEKQDEKGTTIRISDVQSDWTEERVKQLIDKHICRFIDPFQFGLANKRLKIRFNSRPILIESIPKTLLENAHAVCVANFNIENNIPKLNGKIQYKLEKMSIDDSLGFELVGAEVLDPTSYTIKRHGKSANAKYFIDPIKLEVLNKLGEFNLQFYWYNRKYITNIGDLTEKQRESRKLISKWSGGPMLYRKDIRILPYGNLGDDWVWLDRSAFGSGGFKLNRQQVIGKVSITSSHEDLSEQTNREGLIESDVSNALINLLKWIIHSELRIFINAVDKRKKAEINQNKYSKEKVSEYEKIITQTIEKIDKKTNYEHNTDFLKVLEQVNTLAIESKGILLEIKNLQKFHNDEQEKFTYLAGIGLITEFIFHELDRAISQVLNLIVEENLFNSKTKVLVDQLKSLQKRISAFNKLSTEKRQTKEIINLNELVNDLVSIHKSEFKRHNIHISITTNSPFEITAVRGMVIQILENLIVNANYWLKRQKIFEKKSYVPKLEIILDSNSKCVYIRDNGPGVQESRKEWIFEPFVTSKPVGLGKGLGITYF